MVQPVFFLSHHLQIVWVIVCPILVTMVDNFMPIKFTTGNVFSYKSVLCNKPPCILESMTRRKLPHIPAMLNGMPTLIRRKYVK